MKYFWMIGFLDVEVAPYRSIKVPDKGTIKNRAFSQEGTPLMSLSMGDVSASAPFFTYDKRISCLSSPPLTRHLGICSRVICLSAASNGPGLSVKQ